MQYDVILPLFAGLSYALGSLLIKRAMELGMGSMRIAFVTNWLLIPTFAWILIFDHHISDFSYIWAAALGGFLHFIAVAMMFTAIRIGDVSVQTPVMGSKVLFVATCSILLGVRDISMMIWISAIMSMIAVYILGKPKQWNLEHSKHVLMTVGLTMGSAMLYAIGDVMTEKYSPLFGEGPYLIAFFSVNALCSLSLIPFFEGSLFDVSKKAWKWTLIGISVFLLTALLYFATIAYFGDAASVNILYNTRVIWSVILVWGLGRFLINDSSHGEGKIMAQRFLGACLMFAAIVLVLTN